MGLDIAALDQASRPAAAGAGARHPAGQAPRRPHGRDVTLTHPARRAGFTLTRCGLRVRVNRGSAASIFPVGGEKTPFSRQKAPLDVENLFEISCLGAI